MNQEQICEGVLKKGMPYHKLPSISILKKLYYEERLSTKKIASLYGSSGNAILLKLKRNGNKPRTLSEGQEIVANHFEITSALQSFFDGLLLGDGCMFPHNNKSACYRHADKHREYVEWLESELAKHGVKVRVEYHAKVSLLDSLCYREFFIIRQRWYPEGKRKAPLNISLSPSILRNWYIGDGSFKKGKFNGTTYTKKSERVMICRNQNNEDRTFLCGKLKILGIETTLVSEGIYIRANSRRRFFQYILSDNPHIPRCYLYKFPEEYYND